MTVSPEARSVTQANMIAGRDEPEERRQVVAGVKENPADRGIRMSAMHENARAKPIR